MGSKLGVQKRRESHRSSIKCASSTQQPAPSAQFPFDTEQHQYPSHSAVHHPPRRRSSGPSAYNNSHFSGPASSHRMMESSNRQPHANGSTGNSRRGDLVRKLSSARSFRSMGSLDSPSNRSPSGKQYSSTQSPTSQQAASALASAANAERQRRIVEAEKILEEIAKEYAAKRAAGLVPTVPVPARTLLWEELARNERNRVGKRGQCIFGRDTDSICGCQSYKKKKVKGQENPGGICECCGHGGPWHRLAGGSMANRTSRGDTRSYAGSSVRGSRMGSVAARSEGPSIAGSEYDDDYYDDEDYDEDDDDDDDDEDDEDISLEVARPYGHGDSNQHQLSYNQQLHQQQLYNHYEPGYMHPPPPATAANATMTNPDYDFTNSVDRSSLYSSNSSMGLPPRLSSSSGANQLEALLKAIKRYRQLGLSEDEIEARIREDFPPVERGNNSSRGSRRAVPPVSYASGELASM
ncbi:hypothetical protein FI667_g2892, partial [Globisporangium splendens]